MYLPVFLVLASVVVSPFIHQCLCCFCLSFVLMQFIRAHALCFQFCNFRTWYMSVSGGCVVVVVIARRIMYIIGRSWWWRCNDATTTMMMGMGEWRWRWEGDVIRISSVELRHVIIISRWISTRFIAVLPVVPTYLLITACHDDDYIHQPVDGCWCGMQTECIAEEVNIKLHICHLYLNIHLICPCDKFITNADQH